ncbi:MAG: DUF1501 domain-containing protein [Chloroflexi bacterium]|nr:DUF1501 domain-containing protein [Chloroflexota bacterium]MCL5275202.1 DUF1501 domain-containing protein [Chloroflexota bacterium]
MYKSQTLNALNVNLPAWMPRMAFAPQGQAPRGDVIVCIFQRGGMDGLNVVVPVADSNYYQLRPTIAIPQPKSSDPKAAIDLDGRFGLHPALAALKPLYDDGALALVHACGSPDPTHSHFDAMDYMERGTPGARTLTTGWLARHLTAVNDGNTSPLRAVGISAMLQASLRGEVPAVALRSIADFHLRGRPKDIVTLQKTLATLYAAPITTDRYLQNPAREVEDISQLLAKVNMATYSPANGAAYPKGSFGNGMLQVAQLIKAEVGLEVACIDVGGWDTHSNEGGSDGQIARLLRELGDTLAAFYSDLGDHSKHVIVVTMSEFGRRAKENGSGGTDHGHGNVMFVMGGSVVGGKVYGDWPTLTPDKLAAPGDLAVTTDYRDVLAEIVSKRLGNPKIDQVFPNYTPTMRGVITSAA